MYKKVHVFRVKPQQELIDEIKKYCQQKGITSGVIIGIIGSVKNAKLGITLQDKFGYEWNDYTRPLSIISAQGTIAALNNDLVYHIHIALSGKTGNVAGHLAEAEIWTTAEVIIGELDYQLYREAIGDEGLTALVTP